MGETYPFAYSSRPGHRKNFYNFVIKPDHPNTKNAHSLDRCLAVAGCLLGYYCCCCWHCCCHDVQQTQTHSAQQRRTLPSLAAWARSLRAGLGSQISEINIVMLTVGTEDRKGHSNYMRNACSNKTDHHVPHLPSHLQQEHLTAKTPSVIGGPRDTNFA
jgi:hypothetical protein